MNKAITLTAVAMLLMSTLTICTDASAQDKQSIAIRRTINLQAEEWNRGNIKGFMESYWNDEALMFIGKNGVTYGWNKTLANYEKGYPDTAAMGKLVFTLIQVERIRKSCYLVTGKWHLNRSIGDIGGHFTLLMKKIKGKWLIVKDHTS